jgi:murein DD-endopeptidase MepM/ murein hydrolase activator NlpD
MIARLALVIALLTASMVAKNPKDLFKELESSKNSLNAANKEKINVNKQLQKIAKRIKKLNSEILEYDKKLDKLNIYLKREQEKYNSAMAEVNSINSAIKSLDRDIDNKNREFAKKISKSLGVVVAQDKSGEKDEKSVILKEFYDKYKLHNQEEILKISKNIEQKKRLKETLIQKRDKIYASINDIKKQKKIYQKKKRERKALLKKLDKEEQKYSKKLKNIFKKQALIRLTLAKLNILKEESAKEAKRKQIELKKRIRELKSLKLANKKERVRALKEGRAVNYNIARISSVKQRSSSYTRANITSYNGPKTRPPLRAPRVIKPFGTFVDPIFKIRSFNDSVTLVSGIGDKRVYNVLNGVVSYVGKNSMLGKFVIIKHQNNIHTIYADLDVISPFVKVNKRLKSGAVVGKIRRKLIFEATKNGKFINPKRLINFTM